MDPITATTTVITLASFIKDLIDVGQSIKRSIDQVRENRRRIRDLTNDILSTLSKLADLSRVNDDAFQTPAQLSALSDLKADMLHVLSICSKISPAQPSPGFRGLGSQIKTWMKRDDIEAEIKRLKKHVNKCYLQFTVFAAARIEDTTHRTERTALRVEHTILVNNVENQAKLRQLEGLMSHVLLKEQFGKNVMNQTIEIIASDTTHETLEFQYLSAQTLRLLDSLQQLVVNDIFFLEKPLLETMVVYASSVSAEHILHQVLGIILTICNSPAKIPFASVGEIVFFSVSLLQLGMQSEATACELLTRKIFRRLAGKVLNTGAVSQLACSSECLSRLYQHQLRWDLAAEANQEAMDWCRLWQEISPDAEYQPLLAMILATRSDILRGTGQLEVAVSVAEEAVALSRTMLGKLSESSTGSLLADWTEPDIDDTQTFFDASLGLSQALSSVGRHFEAYQASSESFRILLKFSGSQSPFYINDSDIDAFIDHMCKVAEGGGFCLAMLADSVILFRDLSRIYPKKNSSQFLRILHAYAYFSPQDCPDFGNLRVFLEPNSDSPPPVLAVFNIDDFKPNGGIIEDAIWDYYSGDSRDAVPLIKIIFTTYSDQAIIALNETASKLPLVDSYSLDWIVYDIAYKLLPVVAHAQQLALQKISTKVVGYFRTLSRTCLRPKRFTDVLWNSCRGFWIVGLLDDAKTLCDEALEYLRRNPNEPNENEHLDTLRRWCMHRAFILYDMGRMPEAIEAAQESRTALMNATIDSTTLILCYKIQIRILQRTRRNREAQQLLRNLAAEIELYGEDKLGYYDHILLFVELAAARRHDGKLGDALKDAERAVAVCRQDTADKQRWKGVVTHSLTILSNCLAAAGRNDEALLAAKEATSIVYTSPRGSFSYSLRSQELGGNAFHSLSLRLATCGQMDESLLNAAKATELYRELVLLAPLHLPNLATSLQNLASIFCRVGRVDESITACEEAISVMRKVAETETYFLGAQGEALDQLAGYLHENGDTERTAAATSEAVEVRRKIKELPPQPGFLFSAFKTETEDEDDGWATATESEEYHGAAADINAVVSEAASATSAGEHELPSTTQGAIEAEVADTGSSRAASQATVSSMATTLSVALKGEERAVGDTAKKGVPDMLSTPLEVKLHLSSTPMDILWWSLVVILSLLVAVLGVALAVLWSRVQ